MAGLFWRTMAGHDTQMKETAYGLHTRCHTYPYYQCYTHTLSLSLSLSLSHTHTHTHTQAHQLSLWRTCGSSASASVTRTAALINEGQLINCRPRDASRSTDSWVTSVTSPSRLVSPAARRWNTRSSLRPLSLPVCVCIYVCIHVYVYMYIYILRPNILSTHPIYAFCHVNISQKNTNISLHFRIEADQYALLVTDFLAKNVINVIACVIR